MLESIEVLQGGGPVDTRELTLQLSAELLLLTGVCTNSADAVQQLEARLNDGSAYERFCRMVAGQGGDPTAPLKVAPASEVCSKTAGAVAAIDTEALGLAIITMGGGRRTMGEQIDHSVGLEMLVRLGDHVDAGQPLVRIFSRNPESVVSQIRSAIRIDSTGTVPPLIRERIVGCTT